MEGHSLISPDVVARYARDAALEVPGVLRVVEGAKKACASSRSRSSSISRSRWGVSIPELGAAVQQHVRDYLARMTAVQPAVVNVFVEAVDGAA